MRAAAHPRLYDPSTDVPILNGVECAGCGHVYFPPIGIGCEICGAPAEQLQAASLAARGLVYAIAQVHLSPAKIETPFTVAEIVLDDGPLIRAMIHPGAITDPQIGDHVSARWNVVGHDDQGDDIVEPAFMQDPNRTGEARR